MTPGSSATKRKSVSGRRTRVRIVGLDGAEAFCWSCGEWYALSMEFWTHRNSFVTCRACDRERSRLYAVRRSFDPAYREKQILKSDRYRTFLRGVHPDLIEVEARLRRQRINERQNINRAKDDEEKAARKRAYNRAWMRQYRASQRVDNFVDDNRAERRTIRA